MKACKSKQLVFALFLGALILFALSPVFVFNYANTRLHSPQEAPENYDVAIVFGAGIRRNGTPSDVLRDRLDTAANLYQEQRVQKILVSGDNRVEDYNEPDVMLAYLRDQRLIPEEDLVADYGGRRTYDTCVRANEIWSLDSALLISQSYHLPRAIYTCKRLGINAEGVSASKRAYINNDYYRARELLAIYKAVIDTWILSPSYIDGPKESDFSSLN